jgi:hypothetical protein
MESDCAEHDLRNHRAIEVNPVLLSPAVMILTLRDKSPTRLMMLLPHILEAGSTAFRKNIETPQRILKDS